MKRLAAFVVVLPLMACRSAPSQEAVPAAPSTVEERGERTSVRGPDKRAPTSATSAAVEPVDAAPPGPPPLQAPAALIDLPVEGFRDAVAAVPRGATERRPVLVALHGNYDHPLSQCSVWRRITRGYPFILCTRGIPRADAPKSEDRWNYGALGSVEKELDAGLEALRQAFPDHVDPGPVIFTGFSLGAILGARIIRKNPKRYSRAVLVEGGYKPWSIGTAKQYAEGGGQRVLFACGQSACQYASKAPAKWLEAKGVPAKVVFEGNIGHTYGGTVSKAIEGAWDWFVEGDDRWPRLNK